MLIFSSMAYAEELTDGPDSVMMEESVLSSGEKTSYKTDDSALEPVSQMPQIVEKIF